MSQGGVLNRKRYKGQQKSGVGMELYYDEEIGEKMTRSH